MSKEGKISSLGKIEQCVDVGHRPKQGNLGVHKPENVQHFAQALAWDQGWSRSRDLLQGACDGSIEPEICRNLRDSRDRSKVPIPWWVGWDGMEGGMLG